MGVATELSLKLSKSSKAELAIVLKVDVSQ